MFLESYGEIANSPFIVPVAGCFMIVGIVAANAWGSTRKRQIESEERLAAIARGVPIPPTQDEVAISRNRPGPDALRRRGNVRRGGIVLISAAVGIVLFFLALASILHERDVLCGAACGLIPLGIGIGLLIDARIQSRELDLLALQASNLSGLSGPSTTT
jgi:hypothetical protein